MIEKHYFVRQAATLLGMAKATKDPVKAAELLSKAADLDERATKPDQAPFVPALQDPPPQDE